MKKFVSKLAGSIFDEKFKKEMVQDLEVLLVAGVAIVALLLFMSLSGGGEPNSSAVPKTKLEKK